MKITSVDILELVGKSSVNGEDFLPLCCKINTDEGISGLGEVGLSYGIAGKAAYGMLKDYAQLLIGEDPLKIEAIWEKLFKKTFWGQGGGTVIFGGISAIDIALWDIKGKAFNLPVYQLLGGKTNEKLRAYASQIQFDWGPVSKLMIEPKDYAHAALKAVHDGYNCVKVDPAGVSRQGTWNKSKNEGILRQDDLQLYVDRVGAIREAVGNKVDIIIELHCYTDTSSAVQLGRALEKYNCFYYEEAVTPLNPNLQKIVSDKVKIPMASGERIYTRWGYRPFFETRSLDVIQPDIGLAGGFSECKKICDMAHLYDINVQMHICGGPLAKAASLQLEAVIPNFLIHEHHASAMLDGNRKLCKYDYQPKNGYYKIPDLPGIGQELSTWGIENATKETIS